MQLIRADSTGMPASLPEAEPSIRRLRRILVPTDGSGFAEHALRWALEIAHHADASLDLALVNVLPPSVVLGDAATASRWEESARDHGESYLEGLAGELGRAEKVAVQTVLLQDTSAARALARHARNRGVDLIVMTTHGRRGVARAWLGSVAEALIRESPVPVLLLRPEEGTPPRVRRTHLFHSVLVALDGSRNAECALEFGAMLGGFDGASLDMLRVVDPVPFSITPAIDLPPAAQLVKEAVARERASAEAYLAERVETMKRRGRTAVPRVDIDASAAGAILRKAKELGSDLLVLGTHGRRGLRRVLLGSVAEEVIRGTSLPTLIVPAGYRGPLC